MFFITCTKNYLWINSISWLHWIILIILYWLYEWNQIFQLALCGARQETNHNTSRCQHLIQHQNTSRATKLPSDDITDSESYRMSGVTLPLIHNCRNGSSSDRACSLDPPKSWQWETFAHHYSTALQLYSSTAATIVTITFFYIHTASKHLKKDP